jgi:hypothetical protein
MRRQKDTHTTDNIPIKTGHELLAFSHSFLSLSLIITFSQNDQFPDKHQGNTRHQDIGSGVVLSDVGCLVVPWKVSY